jgi:nicotinate-nucleotide pyrophosphorylase (carboxylating)
VPETQTAHATVTTRQDAVLCGRPWFEEVFRQLDAGISIAWHAGDGASVAAGTALCELRGPARPLLTGERTALNFLQTLSATATAARACATAVAGTRAQILDTRKTIPGLRTAQKYAVRIGGAQNHRMGLFDGILVKENHIVAAGGITRAVREARRLHPGVLLEVEVETLEQAAEAFGAGADRLLLDNFPLERLRAVVRMRAERAPRTGLEASGGITLENLREVAGTGVDFVSMGDLTKNVQAVDLSMRFRFDDA